MRLEVETDPDGRIALEVVLFLRTG